MHIGSYPEFTYCKVEQLKLLRKCNPGPGITAVSCYRSHSNALKHFPDFYRNLVLCCCANSTGNVF